MKNGAFLMCVLFAALVSAIDFVQIPLQEVTVVENVTALAPLYYQVNATDPAIVSLSINMYCETGCQNILELNVSTNAKDIINESPMWQFKNQVPFPGIVISQNTQPPFVPDIFYFSIVSYANVASLSIVVQPYKAVHIM